MNITPIKKNGWLKLRVEGRLDAAWSEHFYNTVAASIREGMHDIRIDAEGLEYLSSAMLRAHKELKSVNGSFAIIRASEFVVQTLAMSGFESLLALDTETEMADEPKPAAAKAEPVAAWKLPGLAYEVFEMDAEATMAIRNLGAWTPWQAVDPERCPKIVLGRDTVALGTGAPGETFAEARERLGDFVAAAGGVTWLPGSGADAPDYLVQEGRFVPELICANALLATGGISHLIRFQPKENAKPSNSVAVLPMTGLIDAVLATTNSKCAVFVALAEVEGLVGMSVNRSPGLIKKGQEPVGYPQVCDWSSFCGERVHEGAQALLVGVVDTTVDAPANAMLPALPSHSGTRLHVHAAVFPFHPLANDKIFMADTVRQIFDGAEPKALLHLVEDNRPALGRGQSTFRRGAIWCAPAQFVSEDNK